MSEMRNRILIVDDEMSVREVLSRTLTQDAYRCVASPSAEDALARFDEEVFDLALLDLRMPGMSGMDLLRVIKGKRPDTAVIMITAVDDTEQAVEVMRLGAYDYILKPFFLEKVRLSVKRALETRRLSEEIRIYQMRLEQRVREQTEKIRQNFLGSIEALVRAMEAKDAYTRGHTERVMALAVMAARELGLDETLVEQVRLGSLLHDIGKIGVMEAVLLKPGPLTPEEYAHIITHTTIGEYILHSVVEDTELLRVVRTHHERFDGSGHPEGLQGAAIPQGARIIGVADAYDAMTSARPYRSALPEEVAQAELQRHAGAQFDPEVVEAFLRALARKRAA